MALSDAAPNAVAAWTLDEASGSRADQVGSSTLSDNNTVSSAAGMFGNAASFVRANSEWLSIADSATLSAGDIKIMFRAWVQLASKPSGAMSIISKRTLATGSNIEYSLGYDGMGDTDRLRFFVSPDGSTPIAQASANNLGSPSTGTWYLIHAWHDSVANEVGIAVNAGTANTTAHSTGIFDGSADFTVGANGGGAEYWDGLIDDVVVLKGYILDATERSEDYNSGTGVAFASWAGAAGHPAMRRFGLCNGIYRPVEIGRESSMVA